MFQTMRYALLLLLFIPAFIWAETTTPAAKNAPITAGKDYLEYQNPITSFGSQNGKVNVVEFFNYGCPACFRFEPSLEKWLKTKSKNVEFSRIPVVFHKEWVIYAKTYYALKAMGLAEKITPDLFEAIHKKSMDLANENTMANFLGQHGVNATDFQSTISFFPGIQAEIVRGEDLMREALTNEYLIKTFKWEPQIPTVIINGKYLVSNSLVGGEGERFVKVLNFLIQKESSTKKV